MMRYWLALLWVIASPLLGQEEPPTLRVQGSSTLYQPADLLLMDIGVVTRDADVKKASTANAEKMQRVVDALKKAGLSDKEFQTGRFSVVPQYAIPPKNPEPNWQPAIVGYEVHNTLKIQTSRLELAGTLIDSAVREGSNAIQNLVFTLRETEQAQARAIGEAVHQARLFAEAAAQAAGVSLKDVLEIEINPSFNPPRPMRMEKFAVGGVNDVQTNVVPGDVEVTASVTVTFGIKG